MFIWCVLIYIYFVIGEHRISRIILGPTGQMVVSLCDDTRSWIVIGMIISCTYHWYESYIILLRTASPGCQRWAYESYGTRGGRSTGRHQILCHAVTRICIYGMRRYGCTYCWTCFTWYMTFWAFASWHPLAETHMHGHLVRRDGWCTGWRKRPD